MERSLIKYYCFLCFSVSVLLISVFALSIHLTKGANEDLAEVSMPEFIDFGKFTKQKASMIKIRNNLSEEVQIRNILASCGCAVIEEYPDKIAPKAVVEIPVVLKANGRSGSLSESISVYWQVGDKVPHRREVQVTVV